MIYIDAREGLSGDMLLAAMIGLLDEDDRISVLSDMSRAAKVADVDFHLTHVEELGETGLGISYSGKGTEEVRRSYDEALSLLSRMHAAPEAKDAPAYDKEILDALFQAEAAAHGQQMSEVHLHEVGRASAIMNMFGIGQACLRLKKAGAGDFVCSTVVTGKGIVVIAHGAVRVPAPACKHLLKGLKHETGSEPGERATPTGLAAVSVLASSQSDEFPSKFRKRSVGFGTRRFGGRLGRTVLMRA
jgi:uncharacterized protein (DUF111 family)